MEERTRRGRERRGMRVLFACSGCGSGPGADVDVGVGGGAGRRERDWPMVALEQQGRGSLIRWPKAELDVSDDVEDGVAVVLDDDDDEVLSIILACFAVSSPTSANSEKTTQPHA